MYTKIKYETKNKSKQAYVCGNLQMIINRKYQKKKQLKKKKGNMKIYFIENNKLNRRLDMPLLPLPVEIVY